MLPVGYFAAVNPGLALVRLEPVEALFTEEHHFADRLAVRDIRLCASQLRPGVVLPFNCSDVAQ